MTLQSYNVACHVQAVRNIRQVRSSLALHRWMA